MHAVLVHRLLLLGNQCHLCLSFPSTALFNEGNTVPPLHYALHYHQDRKQTSPKSAALQRAQSSGLIINIFLTLILPQQHSQNHNLIAAHEKQNKTKQCTEELVLSSVFFSPYFLGITLKCKPRMCLVMDPSAKRSPMSQSQVRAPVQFLSELVC